ARLFASYRIKRAARKFDVPLSPSSIGPATEWLATVSEMQQRAPEIDRITNIAGDVDARMDALVTDWTSTSFALTEAIVRDRTSHGKASLQGIADATISGRLSRAIDRALPTLKGWGCTSLSVGSNFPLRAGLFDLVIIDEASQCLLAHVLPVLYRGKRAVVVGDAMQLPPISRLANEDEIAILKSVGLDPEKTERLALRLRLSVGSTAFSVFDAYEALAGKDRVKLLN